MNTNKKKYSEFCRKEKTIPIFSKDWWLDAVCGEHNWNVCIVEKEGEIISTMPYYITKRYGMNLLRQPPLTQTLGPWIRPSKAKYTKTLAQQKDLMQEMIQQLPLFDFFSQAWHHKNTNWLPFFWNGFSQTTLYTYIIEDLSNLDEIWNGFQGNIRRDIRKATNSFNLTTRDDLSMDDLFELYQLTFRRQKMKSRHSLDFLKRIEKICNKKKCGKILIAEDHEGRRHAGVFIIWDSNSAYYLMGGGHPELRNSGATSLCMWEAIKSSSNVTKRFDFEGSMIESIERFFRAFGAIQTPYHRVFKTPSKRMKVALRIRSILKKI